jgi:hypothetical protein
MGFHRCAIRLIWPPDAIMGLLGGSTPWDAAHRYFFSLPNAGRRMIPAPDELFLYDPVELVDSGGH